MSVVVVRDSAKVVGVLPLRPREVVVAGGVLTAYYCTAVRVAGSHRERGLGSAMLDVAKTEFCGPTFSSVLLEVIREVLLTTSIEEMALLS
jgi:predicted N-acetyltransferase YhbS